MKGKFVVLVGLFISCLLFTSCRKNYICSCSNGASLPIDNAGKTDATAACAEYQDVVRIGSSSGSCKLINN